jgi:biopolymer transport protein TolR
MKESKRTLRMARHHKRNKQTATLNMVSLMDIFTILVFFLLVSAAGQESLPSLKDIKLPESSAEQQPKENIVIMVSNDNILFQGKPITSTRRVLATNHAIIPELLNALNQEARQRAGKQVDEKAVKKRGVTIMGDKEIPYVLLKKIMLTCAGSDFTNISLAVVQKKPEKS